MIFVLLIMLGFICYFDIKTKVISDGLTLLGILAALNWQVFYGDVKASILGITAGIFIMFIMNDILRWQKVGGGDAKLLAMIGSFTNWQTVLFTALLARIIFYPFKIKSRKKSIAYAPFITGAFILVWIGTFFLKI